MSESYFVWWEMRVQSRAPLFRRQLRRWQGVGRLSLGRLNSHASQLTSVDFRLAASECLLRLDNPPFGLLFVCPLQQKPKTPAGPFLYISFPEVSSPGTFLPQDNLDKSRAPGRRKIQTFSMGVPAGRAACLSPSARASGFSGFSSDQVVCLFL